MNIDLVKKHIKNLINSENISKSDLRNMFIEITKETVQRQVNAMIKANSTESLIESTVRIEAKNYINKILKEETRSKNLDGRYDSEKSLYIEQLVRDECERQIRELVRENFTISLKKA